MKHSGPLLLTSLVVASTIALVGCGRPTGTSDPMPDQPSNDNLNTPVNLNSQTPAIAVETATTSATVSAIDPVNRLVTLSGPNGVIGTYRCGPAVRNFNQIQIGDTVTARLVESVAVAIRHTNEPPGAMVGSAVAIAPKGDLPGVVMANTAEVSARIVGLDTDNHTVTIVNRLGQTVVYRVPANVSLAGIEVGDDVFVRYTESIALLVDSGQ
jgi:hypothetical protein